MLSAPAESSMANKSSEAVGRRGFLWRAAQGAAAFAPATAVAQRSTDIDQPRQASQVVPSDVALRVKALESLLVEKGMVNPADIDATIDTYEHKVGPRNGARVIARAWVDPEYRKRLLANAPSAIAEISGFQPQQGEHILALENGPKVHNLVVCTLCSCYPYTVLGLPPVWYKSTAYRSRAVIDPRGVLREFGLEIPQETEVRVWDSTAELRYIVMPERPAGTEMMKED